MQDAAIQQQQRTDEWGAASASFQGSRSRSVGQPTGLAGERDMMQEGLGLSSDRSRRKGREGERERGRDMKVVVVVVVVVVDGRLGVVVVYKKGRGWGGGCWSRAAQNTAESPSRYDQLALHAQTTIRHRTNEYYNEQDCERERAIGVLARAEKDNGTKLSVFCWASLATNRPAPCTQSDTDSLILTVHSLK
ncbi:hypothetical protein EJ05DRAFT_2916 [Pseudovirgaria hyperparasitica]|uniref:Uncharacterized protein n=1 Tax=Pseudovirgaria hyperparasitica TaxID=470096 RepID=A0A6A6WI60_9PEZI|nr:uncharacterized protein EJ05DRAFT_2916 [Pseudovirgaria hyperparasitica]KAF2762478.1 hypothetical protein EJ05DRAFT_2916 [Pseudovirgaria hyperparasitica]